MIFSIHMNFRKSRILNISWDMEQKVKILMTIGEVPKVGILNISKDQEQKLIFPWFAERGRRAECEGGLSREQLSPRPPIKERHGNLKL
jgi:hypothetical protein